MRKEKFVAFFPLLALAACFCCLGFVDGASSLQPPVKLVWHYYKIQNTCRDAEVYIKHEVKLFWDKDKSITSKLLRLVYSDCFITGCDASILLDGPNSEKTAPQNSGLGGFEVIDKIKIVMESRCPGVVSCADILNLATRDAVHLAGAPSYPVFTGRRDGMLSSAASVDLPSPSISWEQALAYFKSRGLDVLDLGTLLGAHSMGRTNCSYILDRLYNFNGTERQTRPWMHLLILSHKAVFEVDQQLLYGNDTAQITEEFAAGFEDFRKSFALSMSRMGNIKVLTGNQGEIRRNCRFTNQ
ncbi:hypothetical protein SLA2020_196460 [Shorea laevis]